MQCAGISGGSARAGHDIVGFINVKQVYEIALQKQKDAHMAHISLESICRSVMGSCLSMGIKVLGMDEAAPSKVAATAVATGGKDAKAGAGKDAKAPAAPGKDAKAPAAPGKDAKAPASPGKDAKAPAAPGKDAKAPAAKPDATKKK